jgi:hypothetical protein
MLREHLARHFKLTLHSGGRSLKMNTLLESRLFDVNMRAELGFPFWKSRLRSPLDL